ncbi:hypothetical protein AHMF7605_28860 [Adhaeribacter arboris]|uniref:Uncharacterized protein n=1 Tax=Adhaeribacter arboris TaxID=2072846 RepID=A0A2T2Y8R9_9BACT|nr:hypothetical protein [Adhaeribacter arboris]PSR51922.1 hypothetical protein AHMF7605_28860 [Adhaeribacter arboris]
MNRRNLFRQAVEFLLSTRQRIIIYRSKYPERIIAGMFLILLVAITIFLIRKVSHKQSHKATATTLINRISAADASTATKPVTTDLMNLVGLYSKAKSINPDSLTLNDSLVLKEINNDLKKILK